MRAILLLAGGLGVPNGAEAAWDRFGVVHFTGGRIANPRSLDDDQPASHFAKAELRRARSDARIRFTDHPSLDMSVSRDARRSLDDDGHAAGTTLTTWRGGRSFTYTLPLGWALIALFTHERQAATATSAIPADIEGNRYAVGASWTFTQ